jgi:hypothetical protein
VSPTFEASTGARWGRISNPDERHDRDVYGYLSEIDPGVDSGMMYSSDAEGGDGEGHRKIGSFGARPLGEHHVRHRPGLAPDRRAADRDVRRQRPPLRPHVQVGHQRGVP